MVTAYWIFLYLNQFAYTICQPCSVGRTDIVLVIDGSASIDPDSFTTIKNASVDFATQAFDRLSNLRIGGVFYGDDESTFLPLYGDVNTVATAIRGIAQPDNAGTMTNKGIDAATAMFQASSSSKEIMVVITDGISNRRDLTQQSAKAAKDPPNNIEIYTVGIIYKLFGDPTLIGMFNVEVHNMASDPNQVITVDDFGNLDSNMSGLLNKIFISNRTSLQEDISRQCRIEETPVLVTVSVVCGVTGVLILAILVVCIVKKFLTTKRKDDNNATQPHQHNERTDTVNDFSISMNDIRDMELQDDEHYARIQEGKDADNNTGIERNGEADLQSQDNVTHGSVTEDDGGYLHPVNYNGKADLQIRDNVTHGPVTEDDGGYLHPVNDNGKADLQIRDNVTHGPETEHDGGYMRLVHGI